MSGAPERSYNSRRALIGCRCFALALVGLLASAFCLNGSPLRADEPPTAIFVMKTDGTAVRQVAQAKLFKKHGAPRWSHDGKRLVFDAWEGPGGVHKFFTVNLDGSGLKEKSEQGMADWSPDDKQLAFANADGKSIKRGLYVENLDGKGRTWVQGGTSPRWSADGAQILFARHRFALWIFEVAEGTQRSVVHESFMILPGFSWAPDGKRFAFVGEPNGQRQLYIADGEGTSTPRCTRNFGGCLSWSPDGKQLAVSLHHLIHLIDVEGDKGPRVIPHQEGTNDDPAFSPDGKWIAYGGTLGSTAYRPAAPAGAKTRV